MAGFQNSIYAPTPFPVDQGGTGNNTALTNGQLWIGRTGNTPLVSTITPGAGISVTNGPGTVTIASTAPAAFTWVDVPGSGTINMVAGNGYVFSYLGGVITCILPSSPAFGDAFAVVTGSNVAVPPVINATGGATINWKNSIGTSITLVDSHCSITLLCTNGSSKQYSVLSTNDAAFSLT